MDKFKCWRDSEITRHQKQYTVSILLRKCDGSLLLYKQTSIFVGAMTPASVIRDSEGL